MRNVSVSINWRTLVGIVQGEGYRLRQKRKAELRPHSAPTLES